MKPRCVRLLPMLALCLLAGAATLGYTATQVSVDEVAEGLTCQCGCGLTVANCNHPQCEFSVPAKEQIEAMIKQGMTRAAILESYRGKYGETILSAPTVEGFNLLAWLMPFGAIAAGCGLLLMVAGRWRASNAPERPLPTASDPGFDPALRQRLEAEIKENA